MLRTCREDERRIFIVSLLYTGRRRSNIYNRCCRNAWTESAPQVFPALEMEECIQDHRFYVNLVISCWLLCRSAFSSCPHTVSYTHLRAHETRHDLVCRLLLEKKK